MVQSRPPVIRQVGVATVPDAAWLVSSLAGMDYADSFTVETGLAADPEWWARALFGDVPSAPEIVIWELLLRFRLNRDHSPFTVAGWVIGGRGDGWIRLEQQSWLMAVDLVVHVPPGQLSLTTLVQYFTRLAPAAWLPLSLIHRRLVPAIWRAGELARDATRTPSAPDHATATRRRRP